jgi:3-deoxy-D-manno-octulosonate 8-phosphate phosphatase (KDO 8-P phosphatase)
VSAAEPGRIKAVVLDVDGVLTDDGFWWSASGEELKRFCFLDVMGISRASRAGMLFALVSGEDTPLVTRYAAKMRIADMWLRCKDKAAALREFAARRDLPLSAVCFMGNDVNDVAAMEIAGLAAAPADAHPSVLKRAAFVATKGGGRGAVRELIDTLVPSINP